MSFPRTSEPVDAANVDAPYLIVTTGKSYNSKTVHVPSGDSTRENPVSLCPRTDKCERLTAKDTGVFPPGFRTVCRECLHYRREQ